MKDDRKVLIIDADADVLIMFEHLLEDEGYKTVTAWSGRDALRAVDRQRFDLILVGDYLPDISAENLMREVQDRGTAPPYIVMRTRLSEPMDVHRSLWASALDVVCKRPQGQALEVIRRHLCG
jgi:DNA-binding response OmpR family regulator